MSDDLILAKNLRSVSSTEAPYANDTVRPWCHQAADTIERLTKERDEARASAFKQAEKFLIDQGAEKGGTKTPQGRTAQYYARKIADMAKAPGPVNG